jgi:hypothetical protein
MAIVSWVKGKLHWRSCGRWMPSDSPFVGRLQCPITATRVVNPNDNQGIRFKVAALEAPAGILAPGM